MIYLVLDKADEHTDRHLARHLVALHYDEREDQTLDALDLPTLTSYITYARQHRHLKISDEAVEDLICGYVEMRRKNNFPGSSKTVITTTSRQIERDPETGEIDLESGALVLSDRGICCIDEFDKMSDNASLNAKTSVLACATPSGLHYNPRLSVIDNIQLPPTLLSRFDLIYLVLDKADEHTYRRFARHLVALHYDEPEDQTLGALDLPTLTSYITYARQHIHPKISDEVVEDLIHGYVEMRRKDNFPGSSKKVITTTPRQIERLIRISEELAHIRFSSGSKGVMWQKHSTYLKLHFNNLPPIIQLGPLTWISSLQEFQPVKE
ncbi:hypothetical protein SUGI_0252530 [Cryptomeria japonica]|nr:hypothetical protein SUGI_0252530 [Cryptomeria japonica]